MTRTSSSSSPLCGKSRDRLNLLFALALVPYGPVSSLLAQSSPWRAFDSHGPILLVARAERLSATPGGCEAWAAALAGPRGGLSGEEAPGPASAWKDWSSWEPWTEEDRDNAKDCDGFPCKLKLDRGETEAMAKAPEAARLARFLELVRARAERYEKTQERKEYEYPGTPVDPWATFETRGFQTGLARPAEPRLKRRRLELSPGDIRAVHQVVDERVVLRPDRREAVRWLRDLYSDHYFDSWGEWARVECAPGGGGELVQAVVLELDLMKDHDLFSLLARGRMQAAVEKYGTRYLERWRERLAREAAELRAQPSGSRPPPVPGAPAAPPEGASPTTGRSLPTRSPGRR